MRHRNGHGVSLMIDDRLSDSEIQYSGISDSVVRSASSGAACPSPSSVAFKTSAAEPTAQRAGGMVLSEVGVRMPVDANFELSINSAHESY